MLRLAPGDGGGQIASMRRGAPAIACSVAKRRLMAARVALPSVAAVLLQRDAVGKRRVERLVGFGETGGGDLRDGLHGC